MRLKQLHQNTWVSLEDGESSLKITMKNLFKRRIIEVAYKDILIHDRYELPYHNKYCLGTAAFFFAVFIELSKEPFLNPHSGWTVPAIFGACALIEMIRFIVPRTRILIPTKSQGLIRLYKKAPTGKKVQEFMYELEGKADLYAVKEQTREVKIDLDEWMNR